MSQNYEYFGKYILLEKLAAGGMAEVWLARAPGAGGIGKFVAIKKILPQFSDNPEFIQMFRDEAAIAMNLSHSNIVGIFEFGQEKQQLFLVLDYVEGRNLRQILNKMKTNNQSFNVDQIIYMVKEIAAGLDHAHRSLNSATGKPLNITHRDMSPQNIMTSFEGEVKIIDFGIAKAENQMENTKTGTLKGKFGYMSPEQAEGLPTDLRTDVFSLGIVLWELLANDRLFIANNEINTLRKIRECQVPSLSKINPNIHPELERIVMKALTRDRNLRYQTAAALHRDLNRYLNRQYPDFSPHDFSVFIKTIFADEILETRQKLIDYSKIPFPEQMGKQSFNGDKTVITSFAQTSSTEPQTSATTSAIKVTRGSTQQFQHSPTAMTKTETFSEVSEKILAEENSSSEGVRQDTVSDASGVVGTGTNAVIINKDTGSGRQVVLDMAALKTNMQPANQNTGVRRVSARDMDAAFPDVNEALRRDAAARAARQRSSRQKQSSWGPVSFFIAVGAVIGLYVVLNALFPSEMNKFQRETSKAIGQLAPPDRSAPTVTESASTPEKPQAPVAKAIEVQAPVAPADHVRGLIVNSVPSGAEIIVDGKSTGEFTPARISVPAARTFNLTLKKSRYIDYVKNNIKTDHMEKGSFTATLQKAMVAYINIDVKPARNVKVTVNGVVLEEDSLPISGYAIPASQVITIRAQNLITGQVAEQTVELYADERKSILLRVDKNRLPSSN